MVVEFTIVDLQAKNNAATFETVRANSPKRAAAIALGLDLLWSGKKQNRRARVYSQRERQPKSIVRLYQRLGHQAEKGQKDAR